MEKMYPLTFNFQKETGINFENYEIKGIDLVLIPSIPGRHTEKDREMQKYGLGKVQHIMKLIGPTIKNASMTYNSSSLGVIDQKFIRQLFFSFIPNQIDFKVENFKLIYPSSQYITEKTCGESQVLFLKKENF